MVEEGTIRSDSELALPGLCPRVSGSHCLLGQMVLGSRYRPGQRVQGKMADYQKAPGTAAVRRFQSALRKDRAGHQKVGHGSGTVVQLPR